MFILIYFLKIPISPIKLSKLSKIIKQELFRFQWNNKKMLLRKKRNMNRVLILLETPFWHWILTAQLTWQKKYLNTWFVTDENEIDRYIKYASVLNLTTQYRQKEEVFLWLALKIFKNFVVRVATKFQKPKQNEILIVIHEGQCWHESCF